MTAAYSRPAARFLCWEPIGQVMALAKATLVVGPSWIGDAVMSQCLLAVLASRSTDTAIDVLAPESVRPVFARMPQVRTVLVAPFGHGDLALRRRLSLGAELRGRYDNAYVLPGSWKSALVPWAAAIPKRSGYLREWRYGLINAIYSLPEEKRRMTAVAFQALADPDVASDTARLIEPRLRVDRDNLDRLLERWRLDAGGYVAMAPGAEYGEAKRWPLRHWIGLCEHLDERGLRPLLLGSRGDNIATAAIAARIPSAIDLAGQTTIEDAIDLLSACRVAITNNSGLMHVAAAVGRPVVAIYGSTSPQHTPPLSRQARIVTLGLPCSPCWKRQCPLGHLDCLEKLLPEQVLEQLRL